MVVPLYEYIRARKIISPLMTGAVARSLRREEEGEQQRSDNIAMITEQIMSFKFVSIGA